MNKNLVLQRLREAASEQPEDWRVCTTRSGTQYVDLEHRRDNIRKRLHAAIVEITSNPEDYQ